MSQLLRFFAIDNISRGQIVEVQARNHTNLNGVIRAGKTTTLRALLLFYGARPGDIAQAKGDAFKNFASFYFPRPSSYLVFEYQKAENTYCVIASAKHQQVRFQFLDTGFHQDFFIRKDAEKSLIVDSQQLRVSVEAKGHELTSQLGADAYANIIQSSKVYRGKGANAEQIRRLRPKYSMPANGKSIENIQKVLLNIFANKASVASVRNALTRILIQDGAITGPILKLDDQASEVGDWIEDRQAWKNLDAKRDTILSLAQNATDFIDVANKLSGLQARRRELFSELEQALKKLSAHQQQLQSELEKHINDNLNFKESSDLKRIELEASETKFTNQINTLIQQKKDFEEGTQGESNFKPIAELIALYNARESLEQEAANARRFHEQVSAGLENIIGAYQQRRSQLDAQLVSSQSNTSKLKLDAGQQVNSDRNKTENLFKQRLDNETRLWKSKLEASQKELTHCVSEHSKASTLLENITVPEELSVEIANIRLELGQAQQNATKDSEGLFAYMQRKEAVKLEYDKALEQIVNKKHQRESLLAEQKKLQNMLGTGTLFDYLSENVDGFEADIGKVISPQLLAMKGLNPSFTESTDSLYGLQLDLDAIPAPEINDEGSITERIVQLDEKLAILEEKIELGEKKVSDLYKSLESAKSDIKRGEFATKASQSAVQEIQVNLDELLDKEQFVLEQLKDERTQAFQATGEAFAKAKAQHTANEQERDEVFQRIDLEKQKALSELDNNYNAKLVEFDNQLEKIRLEISQKKKDLSEQEAADMAAKGCSPETINQAKKALDRAEKKATSARNAGERVSRYNKFMQFVWVDFEPKSHELEKIRANLAELNEKVSSYNNKYKTNKERLEREQTEASVRNKELNLDMDILDRLNRKLNQLSIEEDINYSFLFKGLEPGELGKKFNILEKESQDISTEGNSKFNIIKNTFNHKAGTQTFKFFERLMEEQTILHATKDLWWACAPLLQEYLDGEHIVQADLLRTRYLLVAQGIVNFSSEVNAAHDSLNLLGRKLSTAMKGIAEPFEAIGELEVKVSSNLRNVSYFSALERYSLEHETWKLNSGGELPDDRLIVRLENLIDMLGSKSLSIDVEKSFQFEMLLREDGVEKVAKTDDECENISSNGTSYLIIVSLYIGLINMMRSDSNVTIHLIIDELGRIDTATSGQLIKILEQQNIRLFSALPVESAELLQYYPDCYMIESTGANRRRYSLYGPEAKVTVQDSLEAVLLED